VIRSPSCINGEQFRDHARRATRQRERRGTACGTSIGRIHRPPSGAPEVRQTASRDVTAAAAGSHRAPHPGIGPTRRARQADVRRSRRRGLAVGVAALRASARRPAAASPPPRPPPAPLRAADRAGPAGIGKRRLLEPLLSARPRTAVLGQALRSQGVQLRQRLRLGLRGKPCALRVPSLHLDITEGYVHSRQLPDRAGNAAVACVPSAPVRPQEGAP